MPKQSVTPTITLETPGITTLTSGSYSYKLTPFDLAKEQKAFEPGQGVSGST